MKEWNVVAGVTIFLVVAYCAAGLGGLFLDLDGTKVDVFQKQIVPMLTLVFGYVGRMLRTPNGVA